MRRAEILILPRHVSDLFLRSGPFSSLILLDRVQFNFREVAVSYYVSVVVLVVFETLSGRVQFLSGIFFLVMFIFCSRIFRSCSVPNDIGDNLSLQSDLVSNIQIQ